MIASLEGTVVDIALGYCVLSVGGVGYLVHTTPATLTNLRMGTSTVLHTHLIVRETALDLYGFTTVDECRFFELLMRVSGVGPKSALSVLALADVATLQNAISSGEIEYLTKVSGIGKKLAQKIVLELRDKVGAVTMDASAQSDDASVLEALETMGYKASEARTAIKGLSTDVTGLNARVAAALKLLAS